jgi:hypothetical protein
MRTLQFHDLLRDLEQFARVGCRLVLLALLPKGAELLFLELALLLELLGGLGRLLRFVGHLLLELFGPLLLLLEPVLRFLQLVVNLRACFRNE